MIGGLSPGAPVAFFMAVVSCVHAQSITESNLAEISFDQKLNTQVNLDLRFRDEQVGRFNWKTIFWQKARHIGAGLFSARCCAR